MSVWEALVGRAPGQPLGPADAGLWQAVAERLNPARAKPRLRQGIEEARLVSARGVEYVMLRSPDGVEACYLRLAPEELRLAKLMDGTRTVARLVAEFARLSGRLAPDQVTRIVADLAGNRMLEELPVDAFFRLQKVHRLPWPIRLGRAMLATAKGQRVVLASIDPLVGFLYKIGGRLFFTRVAAWLCAVIALAGLAVFVWSWMRGDQSVFLTGDSYVAGALVLLGLNVLALACHELGHALATKHAGRRVPAAGFLVYFGIPSVFVDTTDVWMAGRKARIVTTAAGPATGLFLAGAAQLVGLFVPELAPWTFKLAFAWYLNALFNLNPFLALDGYYLLMDWLEVPNLRARGLAWVIARLRRRPPRFTELDREGRLVALYGMLAVAWIAIAVNLAYRIYTDRVAGLTIGLWRAGWPARLLLAAVVAVLAAPLVYVLMGWVRGRLRRGRERFGERRLERDAPRRLAALRSSALGQLPASTLTALAARSRWVHPRTGEQLIFAGTAQSSVYVVVDGALEARRPGDPSGWVRERVGHGGVVGVANALTGAPAALAWHTAGTTLLAVPASAFAAAVGPVSGPPPAEWAELETLLLRTRALAGLSNEDRLGLLTRARPTNLAPGEAVPQLGPEDAAIVASGVLVTPEGAELRNGSMIGPFGEGPQGPAATARTPSRLWTLPAMAGMPLLVGVATAPAWVARGRAPLFGAHPPAGYPPLAAPPGPPPSNVDDSVDRRFERKLWWLLILLMLFALFLTGTNLFAGPVWAEMPSDRALVSVNRGSVTARVDGVVRTLTKGEAIYVHEGDTVEVANRSTASMTFRGGAVTVLCAGTDLAVGALLSEPSEPIQPTAQLSLGRGRLLVDTVGTSAAFEPLSAEIANSGPLVTNDGVARFAVTPGSTEVRDGLVNRGGLLVPIDPQADLTCGEGVSAPRRATTAASPESSDSPSPSPSPSESPSASPSPSDSPTTGATRPPTRTPTRTTTTRPPTTAPPRSSPPPTTSPPPPPDTTAPSVVRASFSPNTIYPSACLGYTHSGTLTVYASGVDDPLGSISVYVRTTLAGKTYGPVRLALHPDGTFQASIGNFSDPAPSDIGFDIYALDDAGNESAHYSTKGYYASCQIG